MPVHVDIAKAGAWLAALHVREPELVELHGLAFREVFSVTTATGGVATNVLPARFTVNLNHRFPPIYSLEEAETRLRQVAAAADEVTVKDRAPAGGIPEGNPLLDALEAALATEVAAKQGWTDVARLTGRGEQHPVRWTAVVSVSCCHLAGGGGECLSLGHVPVASDEPLGVVELGPSGDGLAEVVDGVMQFGPQALFFEGADEPFGAAVGFGLTHEGGIVCDAEPGDRPDEVAGPVLGSPVVTQRDASGDVGGEAPEAVYDGVVDGLEGGDAVTGLGDMGPGFG